MFKNGRMHTKTKLFLVLLQKEEGKVDSETSEMPTILTYFSFSPTTDEKFFASYRMTCTHINFLNSDKSCSSLALFKYAYSRLQLSFTLT